MKQDPMTQIANVGDGWHPIITRLEEALTALDVDYTLLQLKEKMGGLRYYVSFGEDVDDVLVWATQALISAAEAESLRTCETCGERGQNLNVYGWLRTLCDDHLTTTLAARKAERDKFRAKHEARRVQS